MNNGSIDHSKDQNIIIRSIVEKYFRNWKWFCFGAALSLVITFFILRFTPPLYQISSSIKIKNEANSGAISEMSLFAERGMIMSQQNNIENEMAVIVSRELLVDVVKELNLNIQYFEKGKSFLEDIASLFSTDPVAKEIYSDKPFNIDFLENDTVIYEQSTEFEFVILSSDRFLFSEEEFASSKEYGFGSVIKTSIGDIIVTPNIGNEEVYFNKNLVVKIATLQSVVETLKGDISINSIFNTEIITLGLKSEIKEKGISILTNVIDEYNGDSKNEKSIISSNTSEFISNRLQVVSDELSVVDRNIEDFRIKNNIIDIESQSGINLQSNSENENKLIEVNNQMAMVEAVEEYLNSQSAFELLPENLGFTDVTLTSTTQKYNELVIRRGELLRSMSELHPTIVNLDEELSSLRITIQQGIRNLKNSLRITIDGLNRQNTALDSKLFAAPKNQRELIDITRQQAVKEELYLYLLQKREEIAISLGIAPVNAKIIDAPYSSELKVYPNKKFIMLGALIVGLLIPFLVLYVHDIIDTKIHSRKDVEEITGIPIVGEVPYTSKTKNRLIAHHDRSGTAESFRLMRTNLDFMLTKTADECKVIMTTSTIGNEGKTFVSLNLAKSLALADNKVLVLGLDLRAPTIAKVLKVKKGIGITNYIADPRLKMSDITNEFPGSETIDLITSGIIPPNPSDLLLSNRLEELFSLARKKYDFIVVDTSPVSLVSDTLVLNKFADMFLYVVRAEVLDKRMLSVPKAMYAENKLNNMAVLVNGVRKSNNNYGYGYGYGGKKKSWFKRVFS